MATEITSDKNGTHTLGFGFQNLQQEPFQIEISQDYGELRVSLYDRVSDPNLINVTASDEMTNHCTSVIIPMHKRQQLAEYFRQVANMLSSTSVPTTTTSTTTSTDPSNFTSSSSTTSAIGWTPPAKKLKNCTYSMKKRGDETFKTLEEVVDTIFSVWNFDEGIVVPNMAYMNHYQGIEKFKFQTSEELIQLLTERVDDFFNRYNLHRVRICFIDKERGRPYAVEIHQQEAKSGSGLTDRDISDYKCNGSNHASASMLTVFEQFLGVQFANKPKPIMVSLPWYEVSN